MQCGCSPLLEPECFPDRFVLRRLWHHAGWNALQTACRMNRWCKYPFVINLGHKSRALKLLDYRAIVQKGFSKRYPFLNSRFPCLSLSITHIKWHSALMNSVIDSVYERHRCFSLWPLIFADVSNAENIKCSSDSKRVPNHSGSIKWICSSRGDFSAVSVTFVKAVCLVSMLRFIIYTCLNSVPIAWTAQSSYVAGEVWLCRIAKNVQSFVLHRNT